MNRSGSNRIIYEGTLTFGREYKDADILAATQINLRRNNDAISNMNSKR